MNSKLKSIFYDMRHQPVVTWITLVGTTLTTFLIILVVAMQSIGLMPFPPESCRDRLLMGMFIHTEGEGMTGSSHMSYTTAKFLYSDLDGVETVSYLEPYVNQNPAKGPTDVMFEADVRCADANFFKIFDHQLVEGRYYTEDEVLSGRHIAVLTESMARNLFGTEPAVDNTFVLGHNTYTVAGIVRDHSKLALSSFGDIFIPIYAADSTPLSESVFGTLGAALLVKEGFDKEKVREQVKVRYSQLDTELAPSNKHAVYHESPFDQETVASGVQGSNVTPDKNQARLEYGLLYGIFLLVPAINLSTMLYSRLRRRVSEIGVRRAFGCTRLRIIADIVAENLVLTLVGGIAGLGLAAVCLSTVTGLVESGEQMSTVTVPLSLVLNWRIVAGSFAACFMLNLISAAVPAWHASRLNPVNAINMERQ